MTLDKDHISQLIMEKVLGSISKERDGQLQQLMDRHSWIREEYIATLNKHSAWADSGITPPNPAGSWEKLNDKLNSRSLAKRVRYVYIAAAVALLFIAAAAAYLYFGQNGPLKNNRTAATLKKNQSLNLTLASGEVIHLTKAQGALPGGLTFTNDTATKTLTYNSPANAGKHIKNALNTLFVPVGKDYKVKLPDGSLITLNAATELKFPSSFTGPEREIYINGEAYLNVTHNAARPFIVHLPGSTVKVLGTQFNVNTYTANQQKVALVKGAIEYKAAGKSILLKPGSEAVLSNHSITKQPLNMDELAWMKGEYIMNNTPISEIAQVIQNWYGVQVTIDNASAEKKRFTGIIYKNKPLEDFLFLLKGTTAADYYYRADVLHIK